MNRSDDLEIIESEIRKIADKIFVLNEHRNINWKKLSKKEKQDRNAYMLERNSHSIEWKNKTAEIIIPIFKYVKIKYQKYLKENSYSEKLIKTVQDCLLAFDRKEGLDFIHYLNKSISKMLRWANKREMQKNQCGGMTNNTKIENTIQRLGKNIENDNVQQWSVKFISEYYADVNGKEHSVIEEQGCFDQYNWENQDMLSVINAIYLSYPTATEKQRRKKEYIAALITRWILYDVRIEISNITEEICQYDFIDRYILREYQNGKSLTQECVAGMFHKDKTDASRTMREFLEKLRKKLND